MYCLSRLIILKDKIKSANIPRGCVSNEEAICPRKIREIDLPRPHPGQKSRPAFLKGHTVKWLFVSRMARTKRPVIQQSASKGIRFSIVKDKYLARISYLVAGNSKKKAFRQAEGHKYTFIDHITTKHRLRMASC